MISVLVNDRNASGFKFRGTAEGLFAGQEIRVINGPLFVNHPYQIERKMFALSESRRIESNRVKSSIFDGETGELACEVILNSTALRDSYEEYVEEATALGKEL
jgi:hypothetical protein